MHGVINDEKERDCAVVFKDKDHIVVSQPSHPGLVFLSRWVHREDIIIPWKGFGHLLYTIVRGGKSGLHLVWLWHKCRKL